MDQRRALRHVSLRSCEKSHFTALVSAPLPAPILDLDRLLPRSEELTAAFRARCATTVGSGRG
eukprot:917679-Prymnesium_polylepis.1